MEKRGLILIIGVILFLSLFTFLSADSIDSEIKKITSYAEDYETGNINYIQLLVYTSSVRENMNFLLGATDKDIGGVLRQQQIEDALGSPNQRTRWVWAEGADYEIKLDSDVPVWRKIIFDGKKIQIRLSAHPSIILKRDFNSQEEKEQFNQEISKRQFTIEDVAYRLNIEINFKKPKDQLDILGKIEEIKSLAENFNSNPTNENAEELAKTSVDAEKLFWNYYEQSSGKCEDLMSSIFGSENKREDQGLIVQEINFYSGDNFEAIVRLEMCDECQWNWVGLDMRIDSRGKTKPIEDKQSDKIYSQEQYTSMEDSEFESEIAELLDEIKSSLAGEDYTAALSSINKLRALNNAWNEKSNNVWKELDAIYRAEEEAMTDEERREMGENYGWIKRDQERRQKEMEMRKENYELRKEFYVNLFADYDKTEFYYNQIQFEKRLIEEFVEFGEEICDNNQDDNEDGSVDCSDSQCGGKFCGRQEISATNENETATIVDLYCIAGTCQAKEEIIEDEIAVCGNHICEMNETKENCAEDCSECVQYEAINCSGKVIFSGVDANNCPLPPVCIEESKSCTVKEDCVKPLCGEVDCIEGQCQLTTLTECEEAQCTDGDKKILKCDAGEELVKSICMNGVWSDLDVQCTISEETETETIEGEVVVRETEEGGVIEESEEQTGEEIVKETEVLGNACSVRDDCGNENDVCSNGHCVTLPEAIKVEETREEEETEKQQEEQEREGTSEEETPEENDEGKEEEESEQKTEEESETPVTGESILNFFKKTLGNFALIITGKEVEEEVIETPPEDEEETSDWSENSEQDSTSEGEEISTEESPQDNSEEEEEDRREAEEERRREEERERRENDCERQCNDMCYNNKIRPCVEECIREVCGDMLECDVDEESGECEDKCKEENNIEDCTDSCFSKCMEGGENWWQEFQFKPEDNQKQMEKGVFNSGGGCRTSQGQTEAFIWFNGWGEPFQAIEPLKQKYYTGGQTDWCKSDLENLLKQRAEFEKGFNYEFVKWFFDDYLANSAEDWEQHVSGIFEVYWKNTDNLREIAMRMNCLDINEFPVQNLISVQYESEYGMIEYWEELKTVKMPELDGKEITIVSPYMKFWIFPPKEFLKYEMKKAMTSGEFPGSPEDKMERKNEEGLTEDEKNFIKQNSGFMDKITKIAEKYGGNLDLVLQLKDFETNEVVFNLYVQVNQNDIIKMQPMLPEEVPSEDVRVEVDFQEVYDLVYSMEKEMQGEQIESPPWDKKSQKGGFKEIKNGVQMYFKVRGLMNSAQYYPADAEGDVKDLAKTFFKMMMQGEKGGEEQIEQTQEGEEDVWASLDENSEEK